MLTTIVNRIIITLISTRTMSMPVIESLASSEQMKKKKSLELAWDPLTGESLVDQVLLLSSLALKAASVLVFYQSVCNIFSIKRTRKVLTLEEKAMSEDSQLLQQGFNNNNNNNILCLTFHLPWP